MMTDILLINAPVNDPWTDRHAGLNPPLGLAYIAAVLMKSGYKVSVLDLNLSGLDLARMRRILASDRPRILGISAHTETYLNGLEVARVAKEYDPSMPVIMGGPHPTVMYQEVLQEDAVDYVVRGEGEYTMLELVSALLNQDRPVSDISGIAFKDQGDIRVTAKRSFIDEPDELPFPARELFPLNLYPYPGNILTSGGGCPFSCSFCAVNNIWEGRRVFRSPESVKSEVLYMLTELGIREINFSDDTFTLNREHVLSLCRQLRTIEVPFFWKWTCSTRVDLIDRELLENMYDAGCSAVQFGAETGSQQILDAISKKITLKQVVEATKMAKEIGLDVLCSFMFPHPDDTEETIRDQIDFMKQMSEAGVKLTMSLTTPYPGTPYFEDAAKFGIRIDADRWDQFDAKHLIITTRNLSKDALSALLDAVIEQVGLMPFAVRGSSVRTDVLESRGAVPNQV